HPTNIQTIPRNFNNVCRKPTEKVTTISAPNPNAKALSRATLINDSVSKAVYPPTLSAASVADSLADQTSAESLRIVPHVVEPMDDLSDFSLSPTSSIPTPHIGLQSPSPPNTPGRIASPQLTSNLGPQKRKEIDFAALETSKKRRIPLDSTKSPSVAGRISNGLAMPHKNPTMTARWPDQHSVEILTGYKTKDPGAGARDFKRVNAVLARIIIDDGQSVVDCVALREREIRLVFCR